MSPLLHRPRHSPASVPIPKFANLCGTLQCELRNQRDTSNSMVLVPLFEPEVRNRFCSTTCANFGFGALAGAPRIMPANGIISIALRLFWRNCPSWVKLRNPHAAADTGSAPDLPQIEKRQSLVLGV